MPPNKPGSSELGRRPQHQPISAGWLRAIVWEWQLRVDLGRQPKFPDYIATTSLCADVVLTSGSMKQVVLLELTVLWEDWIEEANQRKKVKYHCRVPEQRLD